MAASRCNHGNPRYLLSRNFGLNFLVTTDCFLVVFADFLWWAGDWILSTQKFSNQNCSDEGIPSDNLGLTRLSYVNIFQDSQTRWTARRYVDEDVLCRWRSVLTSNIKASSRSETKSQKSYFSTQDTLTNFKKIQWQIINFDKSLKIMWHGRDAITTACSVYLSLLICGHVFTITIVECVFVHSIVQGMEGRRVRIAQIYFAFYCIFFWKRPSLIFHPSYQNGGKILSTSSLP